MAGKVFFSVSMSLDGFMAPEAMPVEDVFSPEGQNDPRARRWMTKWSELQAWAFPLRFFRENLNRQRGAEGRYSALQLRRSPRPTQLGGAERDAVERPNWAS